MSIRWMAAAVACGFAAASTGAWAKAPPRYGVLVYSDACWEPQSGDAAGHRITVRRLGDGDDVLFEYGEDGPLDVVTGQASIDPDTGVFRFEVMMEGARQGETEKTEFVGRISDEEVTGEWTWLGRKVQMRLPRVRDLGRKIHECRLLSNSGE